MNINPSVNADVYGEGKYVNLKKYILLNLGYPVVRVELTDEHIAASIIDAITLFTKFSGEIEYKMADLSPVSGANYCELPYDPDYEVEASEDDEDFDPFADTTTTTSTDENRPRLRANSIVDVIFTNRILDRLSKAILTGGLVGGIDDYVLPMISGGNFLADFDITHYYLYASKIEDFKKVLGIQQTWGILDDKIYLYPETYPWHEGGCSVLYVPAVTESFAEQEQWIKEYALARCKIQLGTIRAKMSGYQSAGINVAADAGELKSEGKEEMAALREELKLLSRPMPIFQI